MSEREYSAEELARPYRCDLCGYPITWQPTGDGCKNCDVPVFIVERSAEGSGIAPGDRISFTEGGVVNFGIPPVPERLPPNPMTPAWP